MLRHMPSGVWLHNDDQFEPGKQLFRSERRFAVWAYALSHSQLLLRTRTTTTQGRPQSRIDLLFKPVAALKTQMEYDGLTVRCATAEEREHILHDIDRKDRPTRVFIIESGNTLDYVVAAGVGWQEDDQADNDPSALAFFVPATDPTRLLPSDLPTPVSAIQTAQTPE